MPTNSKYFGDTELAQAKEALASIADEEKELALAERAGLDVTDLRAQLNDAKQRLMKLIATYEVKLPSSRRT